MSVVSHPASHIDVTPRAGLFRHPDSKLLEGKSMLVQFEDPTVQVNEHVYCEFTRYEVDHDGFGRLADDAFHPPMVASADDQPDGLSDELTIWIRTPYEVVN
jgi:uncharacterized sulfatase